MKRKIISLLLILSVLFSFVGTAAAADNNSENYEPTVDGFVRRLYNVCLDRDPEQAGIDYWSDILTSRTGTGVSVSAGFIFSEEFQSKETTDEEYVEYMYTAFFGRPSDSAGKEYWLGRISEGMTREELFAGFANSPEFFLLCKGFGIVAGDYYIGRDLDVTANTNLFVDRLYTIILGRDCDQEGMNYWTDVLLSESMTGINVSFGFVFSDEYEERQKSDEEYVDDLYRAFMNREPDSAGRQFWLDSLSGSMTRFMVFCGFMNSPEFKEICETYGINKGPNIVLPNYDYQSMFQSIRDVRGIDVDNEAVTASIHEQCEYWLNQGVRYGFGSKYLQSGYRVDCSGLITAVLRRALGTMADAETASERGVTSAISPSNFDGYQDMTYRGYWYDNRTMDYPKTEGVYNIRSGGRLYVDSYGIGSPLGMDTYEWEALLNNYYPCTSDKVYVSDIITWSPWDFNEEMPRDTRWLWLDAYNEGDIIIWYNRRGVSVHTGFYDGHGGVYHSSSFNLETLVDDNTGIMHSNLQTIGNYRNSELAYFVIYHIVD